MDSSEDEFESLSRRIEQRERQTRRWVWIWTLIPIVVAFLFLAYTVWQIAKAEGNLSRANAELEQATQRLATADSNLRELRTQIPAAQATVTAAEATQAKLQADLSKVQVVLATSTAALSRSQSDLATTTAELGQARVYASDTCKIEPEYLKNYMGNGFLEGQILLYALELQKDKVPWNEKGSSIEDGFDSPRFAMFVLHHVGKLSDQPLNTLPWSILQRIPDPMDGDIVHYEAGYTMFFYRNLGYEVSEDGYSFEPYDCVIGMTPLGIQALKVNFATIIEYLSLPR